LAVKWVWRKEINTAKVQSGHLSSPGCRRCRSRFQSLHAGYPAARVPRRITIAINYS